LGAGQAADLFVRKVHYIDAISEDLVFSDVGEKSRSDLCRDGDAFKQLDMGDNMEAAPHTYSYENEFLTYVAERESRSARVIVPLVADAIVVNSVIDVGCGHGAWLHEWRNLGVTDILGIDGDYVDKRRLVIPADRFIQHDLSQPLMLNRRFDLVQSLEVGEHIAQERADVFVESLVAHGDVILFSAAVPGQGGEFHVNEQPCAYWRDKFASHGYRTFDFLRPRIRHQVLVEPWYRYNTLLFARDSALGSVSSSLHETEVRRDQAVPEWAPLYWRLRNSLLARLPQESVHRLAILKHKLVLKARRAMVLRRSH
jgi:2-polyprenyl-3-methyl-5-hydroxy-6-metoxy-1,4-benzoquinol methylase